MVAVSKQRRKHMTDTANADNGTKGKRPTHAAYTVREFGKDGKEWLKIGAAWQRSDGSYDTQLYALPLDGRIVHRPIKDRE
jgi:hypothetical protein